jgi:hypothetical protein
MLKSLQGVCQRMVAQSPTAIQSSANALLGHADTTNAAITRTYIWLTPQKKA